MPTATPPPYFPQNSLIPPDPNRWKKIRLALFGCGALLLLAAAAGVYALVYLFR